MSIFYHEDPADPSVHECRECVVQPCADCPDRGGRLLQIRRSHASAKPTTRNPAWFHTHHDLSFVLSRLDEAAAEITRLRAEAEALRKDVDLWRGLYRRALNEASGLTNYLEDRPELRSAEKRIDKIESDARAAIDATKGTT